MNKYGNNITDNSKNDIVNGQINDSTHDSLLEVLMRHRRLILGTTLTVIFIAVVYLAAATPIYTSTSRLYVEQVGPKIIGDYEGVMTGSKNYLYTQGELVKSMPIIASVIEDKHIRDMKTFKGVDNIIDYMKRTIKVDVGRKNDIISVSFDSPYPDEGAEIVNSTVSSYVDYHTTQKRSTVTEVLEILQKEKVERDEELSKKHKNVLEFTKENGVITAANSNNHIVFQRLAKLSSALTDAQLECIEIKTELEAAKRMAVKPDKLKHLSIALSETSSNILPDTSEAKMRLKLRELEGRLKQASSQLTEAHPMVQGIKERVAYLREQLSGQADEFADTYTEILQQKWVVAMDRENELAEQFTRQKMLAQELGQRAAEYAILQSELKRTERLCEILDDRIKELNVTEDTGALNISILEVAQAEDKPARPQKANVMAIAIVLGLLAGSGFAVLRDWLDYRLRSVEEVAAVLGTTVLGMVPKMSPTVEKTIAQRSRDIYTRFKEYISGLIQLTDSDTPRQQRNMITELVITCGRTMVRRITPIVSDACKSLGIKITNKKQKQKSETEYSRRTPDSNGNNGKSKGWLKKQMTTVDTYQGRLDRALFASSPTPAAFTGGQNATVVDRKVTSDHSNSDRGQEVRINSRSVVAEAYRTIRTAIFFGVPKDQAKSILVTSPAPGDGKSTLVSNLAIAMAQAGQKTLILDCDFRKPRQNSIFNLSNNKGVSSVFSGNLDLDSAIVSGPVEGLDILTSGPEVPNPAEVLNSAVFTDILRKLTERYDRIIIDSPPVVPVADSQILAAISDVTILVLRAEKSTRRLSRHAMQNLVSVGARMLGVVVNDVPMGGGRYGAYNGYGYYGRHDRYGYGTKERCEDEVSDSRTVTYEQNRNEVKV